MPAPLLPLAGRIPAWPSPRTTPRAWSPPAPARLRSFLHTRRCLSTTTPSTTTASSTTTTSTLPRPYTFHIGLAFSRKPPDTSQPEHYRRQLSKSFPARSPKGQWRDAVLARWRAGDLGREPLSGEAFGLPQEADREHAMGEDFVFVQPMRGQSGIALGIADGVGGWSASGVDPSLFSQSMMYHSSVAAGQAWAFPPDVDMPSDPDSDADAGTDAGSPGKREVLLKGEGWEAREVLGATRAGEGGGQAEAEQEQEQEIGPREILQRGYDAVLADADVEMGASTACVLTLNAKTGKLRAANLGDSGFLVLRGPSIQHIQRAQTHYFNCPKQLSKYPKQAFKKVSTLKLDSPADADEWECTLRHGDVVLLYTDGMSDNIFASHMLELSLLAQSHASGSRPPSTTGPAAGDEASLPSSPLDEEEAAAETVQARQLARMCVEHARKAMVDVGVLTPFERASVPEDRPCGIGADWDR
ncbi:hypothetical protein CALCODRAFT_144287 [Calocera cornea HHB12733]|uniref:Protein phosphatase n=1 Tax=Calocera cornea HHB12733 TaxID=1353952 RepID=A0A165CSR5_9BASI|nr:hypothetical protein CALCODRAFT_144287 [Calocera cornea HHB12733]